MEQEGKRRPLIFCVLVGVSAGLTGCSTGLSGAWAGLCNTHFWIDRTSGICASIYSNTLPFVTPEALGVYGAFEQALYASR